MKNKKKNIAIFNLMALSSLALVACNNESEKAPTDKVDTDTGETVKIDKVAQEKAIKQAIIDNVKAIEAENVDDYLNGYYLGGEALKEAKVNIENQFKLFDKKITIDKISIIESSDTTAIVEVNETVINTSDQKFVDHKALSKYSMKLIDNKWKIVKWESKIVSELDNESLIKELVKQAITDNIKAVEDENVQDYLNGFIIAENIMEGSKKNAELEFAKYDLKYSIDKMEILNLTDKTAVIQVNQTVNNSTGEGFKTQKSIATYNMKLVNDKWKIESIDLKVESNDNKPVDNK